MYYFKTILSNNVLLARRQKAVMKLVCTFAKTPENSFFRHCSMYYGELNGNVKLSS